MITVDSHAVVRNNTGGLCIPCSLFPRGNILHTSCSTTPQPGYWHEYGQDIGWFITTWISHVSLLWLPPLSSCLCSLRNPPPLAILYALSISVILSFQDWYVNGIIVCNLSRWAFFHSSQPSGDLFRWLCVPVVCSFSLLCCSPWPGCATTCRTVSLLKDVWLFPVWGITNKAVNSICVLFLCEMFSFLWYKCPEVRLLSHMVVMVSIVKKLPNCFPEWLYHFVSPPAMHEGAGFFLSFSEFGLVTIFTLAFVTHV